MTQTFAPLLALAACSTPTLSPLALAQPASGIPPSISTPDRFESRLGVLEFQHGAPTAATRAKIYDNLDYTHAFDAFNNTMRGVSIAAFRKGLQSIGVKDNEVIVFSELMGAVSTLLTQRPTTSRLVVRSLISGEQKRSKARGRIDQQKVGLRSCVSTARSNRSSPRRGRPSEVELVR
jgi:hypothetical protein